MGVRVRELTVAGMCGDVVAVCGVVPVIPVGAIRQL